MSEYEGKSHFQSNIKAHWSVLFTAVSECLSKSKLNAIDTTQEKCKNICSYIHKIGFTLSECMRIRQSVQHIEIHWHSYESHTHLVFLYSDEHVNIKRLGAALTMERRKCLRRALATHMFIAQLFRCRTFTQLSHSLTHKPARKYLRNANDLHRCRLILNCLLRHMDEHLIHFCTCSICINCLIWIDLLIAQHLESFCLSSVFSFIYYYTEH